MICTFLFSTISVKAQKCAADILFSPPSYYIDASTNENIIEYTVSLSFNSNSTFAQYVALQNLNVTITGTVLGSTGGVTNSQNTITPIFSPINGNVVAFTSYVNGPQLSYSVTPQSPSTTFQMNGGTQAPFVTPLFIWRLRASGPQDCTLFSASTAIGQNSYISVVPCSTNGGIVNTNVQLPNNGYICAAAANFKIGGDVKKPNDPGIKPCILNDPNNPSPTTTYGIENVKVKLSRLSITNDKQTFTNNTGNYMFDNNTWLFGYKLTAEKNGNFTCGVSTLDLVLIQKHILATQLFPTENWWQFVAANVNNSFDVQTGKITISTADIIELRRLILGLSTAFLNNKSWRFFDEKSVPNAPNEEINIVKLSKDELDANFIGVKIGDVNGSCSDCALGLTSENPSYLVKGETKLMIPDFALNQGEIVDIPVRIGEDNIAYAYNLGLRIDTDKFEILSVTPNYEFPSIGEESFNLNNTDNGEIKMLWAALAESQTFLSSGQVLFTVRVRAKSYQSSLSEAIHIDNELMENVYFGAEQTNPKIITLDFGASNRGLISSSKATFVTTAAVSDVNAPTNLQFSTPNRGKSVISVLNTQGKEVYRQSFEAEAGINTLQLDLSNHATKSEVYYYIIHTPHIPITGRFIKVSY